MEGKGGSCSNLLLKTKGRNLRFKLSTSIGEGPTSFQKSLTHVRSGRQKNALDRQEEIIYSPKEGQTQLKENRMTTSLSWSKGGACPAKKSAHAAVEERGAIAPYSERGSRSSLRRNASTGGERGGSLLEEKILGPSDMEQVPAKGGPDGGE